MNQEAVEVLSKAAELLPNVAYVHNNLGVALERVGRTDEASAEYMLSTTLSPKYVKAALNHERVKRTAALSVDESGSATDAVVAPGENIGSGVAPEEVGKVGGGRHGQDEEQPEVETPEE
jgi:tetratricopeptide (TPR) repeat protein